VENDLQNRSDRALVFDSPADSATEAAEVAEVDETGEVGAAGEAGGAGDLPGELDVEVLDAIEEELADVERALERLGAGTYGRCETCGGALTAEELVSAPAGRFCRDHRVPDRP
jgi:hypothetical protein